MDRTAGADRGVLPGLQGCMLGPDADLAFRRDTRDGAPDDQARRPCPRRPLRIVLSRPTTWPSSSLRQSRSGCALVSPRPSTTLADLFMPFRFGDLSSAVRA